MKNEIINKLTTFVLLAVDCKMLTGSEAADDREDSVPEASQGKSSEGANRGENHSPREVVESG